MFEILDWIRGYFCDDKVRFVSIENLWRIRPKNSKNPVENEIKMDSESRFCFYSKNRSKKKQKFVICECLRARKIHIVKKLAKTCKKRA